MIVDRARCLSLVPAFALLACASPSTPSPFAYLSPSGTAATPYVGTVDDTVAGSGTIHASVVTVQGVTSGQWTLSFPGQADLTLMSSGSISNNVFTGTLSPCYGEVCYGTCTFTLRASFAGSGMRGTYTGVVTHACGARSATFTLTKQ